MESLSMGYGIRRESVGIFFKLLTVAACFASFGAWFFAGISDVALHIIVFVLFLISAIVRNNNYRFEKKQIIWFLVLFVSVSITTLGSNQVGTLNTIMSILPFFFIFNLKDGYKREVLDFLLNFLGYSMAISLAVYLLYFIRIPLPHSYIEIGHYQFENYYFFVVSANLYDLLIPVSRFSFVFYEPGYTGCLIALLLFIYRFDFKNYKVLYILLASLFFTFSLAGWIIGLFGYVCYRLKSSKNRVGWLIAISIFMVGSYVFFKNYRGGDNIVNKAIIMRLDFSDNSGAPFSGYNRSSENFRDYFWNDFIYSSESLMGRSDAQSYFENEEYYTADWMAYVVRNGWVGLLVFFYFVLYPTLRTKRQQFDIMVLALLFLMIFSQTIYLIYSYMYLTVYSLGAYRLRDN